MYATSRVASHLERSVAMKPRRYDGDRVREHTASVVNERIDAATDARIAESIGGGRAGVGQRLEELDREWDVDRALIVSFAVLGGAAFATGLHRYKTHGTTGLLALFGAQLGFLLLHGVVGWCPPASVFRRLGFRTMREIEGERRDLVAALAEGRARSGLALRGRGPSTHG